VKANNINMMKYSRPLLATLLMSGGLFQLVAPVLAETAAGTAISNTATASYDDPSNPGTPINATSNEVKVIVAEVAGLDVSGSGIVNKTNPGGAVTVGDKLEFDYTVTNVGNTKTTIHIPGQPTVTGPGTFDTLEYLDPVTNTWKPVPAAGVDVPNVAANGVVQVRAVVTVNNGTGSTIAVQLGNTPGDAANQPLVADGNPNNVNTTGGAPANGQRESSATQTVNIGAVVKNIALATVTETRTGVSDNATPANLSDDVISYGLGLKVASTDITNSGITPSALAGSALQVGSTPTTGVATVNRILVSSAIPAGTKLAAAATAPTGWKAVYTTAPTATNANDPATVWVTTFDPAAVYTRVGFITDTDAAVVAPGAEVTGFNFKVVTSGIAATATTYQIDSMAQAFGTTSGGSPTAIVYDESGDQTPNNFVAATPLTPAAPSSSTINSGVADPLFGVDAANDNSYTGLLDAAGEINQLKYTYTPAAAKSLLNGPIGVPEAVGPTSTNDDFTNKSTTVPAGTAPTATFDPAAAGFNNTVKNTGTTSANVSLLPELLAGDPLPVGTEVKISANGQEAIYVSTATGFTFKPGSGVGSNATGPISATNPVSLDAVAPGATAAYQVSVDLAQDATTKPLESFPVVINAFTGGTVTATGLTAGTETATNKTVDRVYTGFVKLTKETRILQGTGPAVQGADGTFSTADKKPSSGNIIEYRITYENISDKLVGTGSSVMKAANLVITENGTLGTLDPVTNLYVGNTWAKDTDSNGALDTSNVVGSAVDSDPTSTIGLFKDPAGGTTSVDQTGTTAATDVTKYVDTVTTVVAPGGTGTFSFKRKLN
jgi:hypothetical protein